MDPAHAARKLAGATVRRFRKPTVSVVMPCRDGGTLLEPAIRSVLNQDLRDLELIVVDDGSTDDSVATVKRLAARDRRVRYLSTGGDGRGPGRARNLGVAAAKGRFLAFADADDQVLPGAYSAMSAALRRRGVDMVVGGYQRHGADGKHRPRLVERIHEKDLPAVDVEACPQVLDEVVIWNRLFRMSFWKRHVGPFSEEGNYEDREPALRAALNARQFSLLARDVYSWRLPDGRQTRSQQKENLSDLRERFAVARREVALLEKSQPVAQAQVWARLLGSDLGLYAVHVPSADDAYWEQFSAMAGWLAKRAPKEVWASVPVWERLLANCAAAGVRGDVEEILGTRAEDTSAVPLTVVDGTTLQADLEVVERLRTPLAPSLMVVPPEMVHAVGGIQRTEWVSSDEVQIDGYAYVPGLAGDTEGLTIRVLQKDALQAHELPLEARTDDTIDIESGDPWRSYRTGGFTVRAPASSWQPVPGPPRDLTLEVHLTWKGARWRVPLSLTLPPADPADLGGDAASTASDSAHVLIDDVQVDGAGIVLSGTTGPGTPELRVGLVTSSREFASAATPEEDGTFQATLRVTDGAALPSDGYFVRWAANGGPLSGWARPGVALREGPIESNSPIQRITARWHPGTTAVSVTVSPPLSLSERSRLGQRRLREVYRTAPLERAVLLEAFNGKTCGDNPGAIAGGLREAGVDVPLYWSVRDLSVPVPEGGTPLVIGSEDWHRVLSTATVLINNNNFPHWFTKRPGQFYLQTWHGTPIKRLLWDLPPGRVPLTYRRLMRRQVPMWDLLLAQTNAAERDLRSGLGYTGPVLVTEQPRNAVLAEGEAARQRARAHYGIPADARVILYA
ncbi:bifunctional glycosyltransferase/CDP-glycerol:glycerophosphate glycerophosphotransferase, partial [Ornithinicoccus hortensis]